MAMQGVPAGNEAPGHSREAERVEGRAASAGHRFLPSFLKLLLLQTSVIDISKENSDTISA